MVIKTGTPLPSEPWRILEVAPNQQPDILASRLSREIKKLPEKMEVLIPFTPNANGEPEWIIEHVYVRGANGSLPRLVRVPGIETARPEIPDEGWIGQLVKREQSQQSPQVKIGQFARILSGPCSMMCGEVSQNESGTATVLIQLKTKKITCYTFPENLQIVKVTPAEKVFYYSPIFCLT